MQINIKRIYEPFYVFGFLYIDDEYYCQTLELPDKDNKRFKSCIPEGEYSITKRKYDTPKTLLWRKARKKWFDYHLQILPAGELQQVVDDHLASFGFLLDKLQVLVYRAFSIRFSQRKLRTTENAGQRVFHLVGDPCSELPESRHLFRLDELRLCFAQRPFPIGQL